MTLREVVGLASDDRIVAAVEEPAAQPDPVALSSTLHPDVRSMLAAAGIASLHRFQRTAIEALLRGGHVALAGGTGSGKSLCYQVPALEHVRRDPAARILYVAPTKALAQDQARRWRSLGADWLELGIYDGDTLSTMRQRVRRNAHVVLTNPDMLHMGILSQRERWAELFAHLELVVIDEAHVYRGVFGAHVANVVRRLRRLCDVHGASPTIVSASATSTSAAGHLGMLAGVEAIAIAGDGAPSPAREVVLWNPRYDEDDERRGSALADAARLYARAVEGGLPTIVFARSRRAAELVHRFAQDRLRARGRDDLADRLAPYRAGYTPEARRRIERGLTDGTLLGVCATNALELGIDIGGVDVAICVTYPGSIASLRQQWGRAGRRGRAALCVLVAGEDALDQHFMREPEQLLGRAPEPVVLDHANPRVLSAHLRAAAAEAPLDVADERWFGERMVECVRKLVACGALQPSPAGHVAAIADDPWRAIDLRSSGGGSLAIVDAGDGRLIGTVERDAVARSTHPGAVYLHEGSAHLVERLELDAGVVTARRRTLPYYTLPKLETAIVVEEELDTLRVRDVWVQFGRIAVTDQLVAYERRSTSDHTVLERVPQPLPPTTFATEGIWFAITPEVACVLEAARTLGSLHAMEHAMIAVLPLLMLCDQGDLGGLSTNWHQATESAAVFLYDGVAGGAGITRAAQLRFAEWLDLALEVVAGCACADGCPSCVQSPRCGNLNEPLDKRGAVDVMSRLSGRATAVTT